MPGFEQMMDSLSFNQRAGKNCAKDWRTYAWFETLDVNSAWKIEKFFFRHPALAKSLGRSFREHQQERGKVVFFDGTPRAQDEFIFPAPHRSPFSGFPWFGPRGDALGKIAVPGRNFYDRRNSFSPRDAQGFQAIARPAVKQVILARPELARCDPVEVFFLRAIIIGSVERRKEPDRMPAQGPDFRRRNFVLPIVVGDRFAQKSAPIRCAQCFKSIGVESPASDARGYGIKQTFR